MQVSRPAPSCFCHVRMLGAAAVELAGELNICPSAVSKSVARGRVLTREEKFEKFLY